MAHGEDGFPRRSPSLTLSWLTFAVECLGVLSLQWDKSDVLWSDESLRIITSRTHALMLLTCFCYVVALR